jgi:hypothetical protein
MALSLRTKPSTDSRAIAAVHEQVNMKKGLYLQLAQHLVTALLLIVLALDVLRRSKTTRRAQCVIVSPSASQLTKKVSTENNQV